MTFVFVPLAPGRAEFFALPKELLLSVGAAFIGVACLGQLCGWRRLSMPAPVRLHGAGGTWGPFTLIYVLLALTSSMRATNVWLAVRSVTLTASVMIIGYAVTTLSREDRDLISSACLACGAATAAVALLQAYGGLHDPSPLGRSPGAYLGNRNVVAALAVLTLPLCLGTGASEAGGRARSAAAMILSASIVVSRSRAAWLAGLLLISVLVITAYLSDARAQRTGIGRLALSCFAGVILACALPTRLDWRSGTPLRDSAASLADAHNGSGAGRVVQAATASRLAIRDPMFGSGPGNWPVVYQSAAMVDDPTIRREMISSVDRLPSGDVTGTLVEYGLLGLALLVGWWSYALRNALRQATQQTRVLQVSALVPAALMSLLNPILSWPATALWIACVLGLGTWNAEERKTELSSRVSGAQRQAQPRTVVSLAVLTCVAVGGAVLAGGRLLASVAIARNGAPDGLTTAIAFDPGAYGARVQLASHWVRVRRCDLAVPLIREAAALMPSGAPPRVLRAACERH